MLKTPTHLLSLAGACALMAGILTPQTLFAQAVETEVLAPLPEVFVDTEVRAETQREVPVWDEANPPGLALPASAGLSSGLQRDTAVLRWLDKMTARVRTIEVPVNQTTTVNTLEFIVRACVERPPEDPPESAAFLDIWDRRPGEAVSEVFRGWMFASSPSVSAMEHPVYDLWVMSCKESEAGEGEGEGR